MASLRGDYASNSSPSNFRAARDGNSSMYAVPDPSDGSFAGRGPTRFAASHRDGFASPGPRRLAGVAANNPGDASRTFRGEGGVGGGAPSTLAALRTRAQEVLGGSASRAPLGAGSGEGLTGSLYASHTSRDASSRAGRAPTAEEQRRRRVASARGPQKPTMREVYSFTGERVVSDELARGKVRPGTAPSASGGPRRGLYTVGSEEKAQRRAKKAAAKKLAFRSSVNELEVAVLERLREVKARSEPPCPLRMGIYRDLFDTIIANDVLYGALLAQIKHEYEVTLNPLESDSMKRLYDEALLENDKLRHALQQRTKDLKAVQDEVAAISKENGRLRVALDERSEQLEELNQRVQASNPLFARQQAQQARISELEKDTFGENGLPGEGSAASGDGADGGRGDDPLLDPRVTAVVNELEAELSILKQKERVSASEAAELRDVLSRIDPESFPPDARALGIDASAADG